MNSVAARWDQRLEAIKRIAQAVHRERSGRASDDREWQPQESFPKSCRFPWAPFVSGATIHGKEEQ